MEKIQVLLAGTGGYGARYLELLLNEDGGFFEFAGAVDPFVSSSPHFTEMKARNIPVYHRPEHFFAEKRADLTIISSPIHTHYPYTLVCLRNGSYVLCEKPVTSSLAHMDELITEEKKSGLFVAVGFQLCFSQDSLTLKKDILDGLFGKPLEFKAICMLRRGTNYYKRNGWAGKLNYEGQAILDSPLQNACSHELMNMLFLLGDRLEKSDNVVSAEAELWQGRPDIENFDAAAIRFITGMGVKIHFYTAHCIKENMAAPIGEFCFEKAVVRWENQGQSSNAGFTAYFRDGRVKTYDIDTGKPLQKFYDTVEAVRSKAPPICTLETVRPHTQCVTLVQQFPVTKVPPEKLVREVTAEGDVFYYAPDLEKALFLFYEKSALPSELGFSL